jgi:protein SCO1/2
MSRRRRLLLPLTMSVLALGALVLAIVVSSDSSDTSTTSTGTSPSVSTPRPPPVKGDFQGAVLPASKTAPEISLRDQYGRPVSLAALRGRPVLIAFLYTGCGAPCTVIAQQVRGALDQLARPIPVLLVSADPGADTRTAVRHFLAQVSLSGRVYYLTGSPSEIAAVSRAYKVRPIAAGAAAFARYATVLLVDRNGRERVLFGSGQLTPEALAHDIGKLEGEPARP